MKQTANGSPIMEDNIKPFDPVYILFEINKKQDMITKATATPASFAAALAILIEEYSKVSNTDSSVLLNMISEAAFNYHAGVILAHHQLQDMMPMDKLNDMTRCSFFEWMVRGAEAVQDKAPANLNDLSKEA